MSGFDFEGGEQEAPIGLAELRQKIDRGEPLTEREAAIAQEAALVPPPPEQPPAPAAATDEPAPATQPAEPPAAPTQPPEEVPPEPPPAEPQPASPEDAAAPEAVEAVADGDPLVALQALSTDERLARLERLQQEDEQRFRNVITELGRATGREDQVSALMYTLVPAPPDTGDEG